MKFGNESPPIHAPNTKLPNKYKVWINDRLDGPRKRFNSFSRNSKILIFVVVFSVIGSVVLQLVSAEDYGSIMTGSDQLVLRYTVPMAHVPRENDFAVGAPPAVMLFGDGLLLCSSHNMSDHADDQTSPLMFMKKRQLNPDEIVVMFEKVRSLGFDNLLVRTPLDAPAPPASLTSSFSLITSVGERRITVLPGETLAEFDAITQYIDGECANATEDFYPDDVVLESIKTTEVADSQDIEVPEVTGELSAQDNEVKSTRLTGEEAKKAKKAISKGNKVYKSKDGKKIKVRLLPKVPEFETPNLYTGDRNRDGIVSAANYRTVKFVYVYAADQAQPSNAQAIINDLSATLPNYYMSQLGKTFSTSGVQVVRGGKTVAQYQSCPADVSCSTLLGGKYPQELATYYNLQPEFKQSNVNTIVIHAWANDNICIGLGGPVLSTDNVNVTDFGFATFSGNNCWPEAIHLLGAHEGGHGFGLVHTCDYTLMDGCGYTKQQGYGNPLHPAQATLLRDSSPYFNGPATTTPSAPSVLSGSTYLSIDASRLFDSRSGTSTVDGQYVGGGRRAAGSVTDIQVAGRAGLPADIQAVSLNVAAINPSATGYITVFPCGTPVPNASNLNYIASSLVANFTISKLGNGKVCVFTSQNTDLIVDVSGAFPANSGSSYTNLSPTRLLDTRGSGKIIAGSTYELTVAGREGVPSNASSVSLNVTAILPQATGFMTVYPCDGGRPNTSSLNFTTGQVIANAVISKIGYGKVCIYSSVTTDVLVDVNGAFNSVTAYSSILPARLLDSRPGSSTTDGQYVGVGRRSAGSTTEIQVAGRGGIKSDALVASLNVAVLNPSSSGFLTVYPCGYTRPNASNVNYKPGSLVANFVISKLGSGKVCVYTNQEIDLLVDVNGAFVSSDVQQYALSQPPTSTPAPSTSNDAILFQPCPTGYTGTYPNCVPPPCPTGYTGTYPNCVPPPCPTGYTGTYPNCVPPPCPTGYTGTYPNCVSPAACTGTTLYTDANYSGTAISMTVGKYTNGQIPEISALSSVKVAPGCKVTLYLYNNFTGATQQLISNWTGAADDPWNDKTRSVEVSQYQTPSSGTCPSGGVTVFKNTGLSGPNQKLSKGSYGLSQLKKVGNDNISSVKVAPGCKVTLYQHSGYSGATKVLTGDWSAATNDPWNDITSSIIVRDI